MTSIPNLNFNEYNSTIRSIVHRHYPAKWAEDVLKCELWSKQVEILNSVIKYRRTAIPSCHKVGKTYAVAIAIAHHLCVNPPGTAGVITSAPSDPQVRFLVWKELNKIHSKAHLPGRMNQKEWYFEIGDRDQVVAFGRKPQDLDYTGFQGAHYLKLLVVFDESCGMAEPLWDGADSLMASKYCRFIAIGNPDDPSGRFAEICKPGSGWNVIQFGYKETPNFTDEVISTGLSDLLISQIWIDEKLKSWGETNPRYISKVLGEFPESSISGLIPIPWITSALERGKDEQYSNGPFKINHLGVDVGGGLDANIVALRQDDCVGIILRNHEPNTMTSLGHVVKLIRQTGATRTYIDYIGIGQGMVDMANELMRGATPNSNDYRLYKSIIGVRVSSKACNSDKFANLRAELFYNLRDRLENDKLHILPGLLDTGEDVAAQLCVITHKLTATGKELLSPKIEIKKLSGLTMDESDAVSLAMLEQLPVDKVIRYARMRGVK